MNKFKYLNGRWSVFILILGLIGCGADNKEEKNQKPWRLGEPKITREGQLTLLFRESEKLHTHYEISDVLTFQEKTSADLGVKMKISSQCFHENRRMSLHEYIEPLQAQYSFYQLLSYAALFDEAASEQNPIKCQINFLAINAEGDTHSFQIRPSPIQVTQIKNSLTISLNKLPLSTAPEHALSIPIQQLAQYSLPPNRTATAKYLLECSNLRGEAPTKASALQFDEFNFSVKKSEKTIAALPTAENCRIFEIEKNTKVLALTERFVLTSTHLAPQVKVLAPSTSWHVSPQQLFTIGKYRLQNIHNEPYEIVVKSPDEVPTYISAIVYSPKEKKYFADTATWPTLITTPGYQPKTRKDVLRFSLLPGQNTTLQVAVRVRTITCPGYNVKGFLYGPNPTAGYSFDVITAVPGLENRDYKAATIELEPAFQNFIGYMNWNGNGAVASETEFTKPFIYRQGICSFK